MASKENQETLNYVDKLIATSNCKHCWNKTNKTTTKYCKECSYSKVIDTLQQAIDNEELYRKSFELVLNQLSKYEYSNVNWLDQARKELENDN